MKAREFSGLRKRLGKTQKELGALLGTSLSAIHGYEQGWRNVPPYVERQLLFIASRVPRVPKGAPCWEVKECPPEIRDQCPAWEFQAGDLCWFINGTLCAGKPLPNWPKKMEVCTACVVFQETFGSRKGSRQPRRKTPKSASSESTMAAMASAGSRSGPRSRAPARKRGK